VAVNAAGDGVIPGDKFGDIDAYAVASCLPGLRPVTIRKWVQRGQLERRGTGPYGRALYSLADIYRLWDERCVQREVKWVVYFIQPSGRDGLIKIGTTSNPGQRLRRLRASDDHVLLMLPGTFRQERMLHAVFDADRVGRSEWFRPSLALLEFIQFHRTVAA
jgi:hypothetical protein